MPGDVLCCAVTCWIEMCHAALNCAVLYCVVEQAVRGIRIMTEMIWILSSSCLIAWLAQGWLQSILRCGSKSSLPSDP